MVTAGFPMRAVAWLKTVWFDTFLRRLARNSSWGIASMSIELGVALAEAALAARILGPADYGRVALVVASIVSIKQLVDVRAWEGVTRYLSEFLEQREPGLALATLKLAVLADAGVAVVAFGLAVLGADLISGRMLGQPELYGPIVWYALTLFATMLNGTGEAVLRVFDRFRDLAVRSGGTVAAAGAGRHAAEGTRSACPMSCSEAHASSTVGGRGYAKGDLIGSLGRLGS